MTTRTAFNRVTVLVLALAILLGGMGVNAYASLPWPPVIESEEERQQQKRLDRLFNEELNNGEKLQYTTTQITGIDLYRDIYGWGYRPIYKDVTHTIDFVERTLGASDDLPIKKDTVLAEFVHLSMTNKSKLIVREDTGLTIYGKLTIVEGKITVEEGATLTIGGDLIIEEGSLINHGTILLEDGGIVIRSKGSLDNSGKLKMGSYSMGYKSTGNIRNTGNINNTGTLRIANGTLDIDGGTVDNPGLLWITNPVKETIGLAGTAMMVDGELKPGIVNNTGNFYIQGSSEVAVHLMSGSTIHNTGKIYKTADTVIKGKITGDQPVPWTPKSE